jgi:hypothetical protein
MSTYVGLWRREESPAWVQFGVPYVSFVVDVEKVMAGVWWSPGRLHDDMTSIYKIHEADD